MLNSITPVRETDVGAERTPIWVGPRFELAREVGRYLAPLPRPLGSELQLHLGLGQPVVAQMLLVERSPIILFRNCPDLARAYDRFASVGQMFFDLPAGRSVARGSCRICGCTMMRACPTGCWWADDTETLCKQHKHG